MVVRAAGCVGPGASRRVCCRFTMGASGHVRHHRAGSCRLCSLRTLRNLRNGRSRRCRRCGWIRGRFLSRFPAHHIGVTAWKLSHGGMCGTPVLRAVNDGCAGRQRRMRHCALLRCRFSNGGVGRRWVLGHSPSGCNAQSEQPRGNKGRGAHAAISCDKTNQASAAALALSKQQTADALWVSGLRRWVA